jgi:hypothetical protein
MSQHNRSDDAHAFLPDPADGGPRRARTIDPLAEALAEDFVESATSAEEAGVETRDEVVPEELGGPFLEVSASEEFDPDPDPSNPVDAEREPFPVAVRRAYR